MGPFIRSLRLFGLSVAALASAGLAAPAAAAPEGQMTWAIHVTLAPKWLDPGETEAVVTPFMVLYALHDALVKLGPGGVEIGRAHV